MHTNRITALIDDPTQNRARSASKEPSPPNQAPHPATRSSFRLHPSSFLLPLLSDYLSAALPLEGLAARHKLTLDQLLDILESPGFQAHLSRLEAASTRRATAIARATTPEATLALADIATRAADKDPEPARKAATQLSKLAATHTHPTPTTPMCRKPISGTLYAQPPSPSPEQESPHHYPSPPCSSAVKEPHAAAAQRAGSSRADIGMRAVPAPTNKQPQPNTRKLMNQKTNTNGIAMKAKACRRIVMGMGAAAAVLVSLGAGTTTQPELADPPVSVLPRGVAPSPKYEPQFKTGYEPGEATGSPADAITWMTFDNTSTHDNAIPWAMSVYYESPGDVNDRHAQIADDPAGEDNKVLHFWLKNAMIDAGYQTHTKGRIQTEFPGELSDAVEVYARQRMFLHEDMNLLHSYPWNGDRWWLSVILQSLWSGAAWQGHPNPSLISLRMYSQGGKMRLVLLCQTMPEQEQIWQKTNLGYALPVGEWVTVEIGYKMGNAESGRMVVILTRESTGEREVVFDVTNWTYDPEADEPGGTGPVPLTHWNPQKLYTSDNMIHHIRDSGGVAQVYWDDFAFSGEWPPLWR